MKRKSIKYVGFYDLKDSKSDRVSTLAATNKMDYIANAIERAGYEVEFVSPSWMADDSDIKFEKKKNVILDDGVSLTLCPSWITRNKITRNIKIVFSLAWLFFYLLKNVKRNEKILAYHVQWISIPIRAAKLIKGFDLILDVGEIYQDIMVYKDVFATWEDKLINAADSFILSTELLAPKIASNKPYIINYGTYKTIKKSREPIEDGKIHLVYAGIIDSIKKGAFNALEASRFLTEDYHLHIIGFGELKKLKKLIKTYNIDNKCRVTYDGLLSGDEYTSYLQSCHIGLSTQSMDGEYLGSSFPSKILCYLSLGLRVVSCYIDCVSKSKIGDIVTYYTDDDPKLIADSIMRINILEDYDSKGIIKELDKQFVEDIKSLLEGK